MSRRPVSLVTLVLSAAVVAGCGTGLEAQTYTETGRQDGAFASVGGRTGVSVQRLQISGPASGSALAVGDTAFLKGGIANNGSTADALVGASSDLAASTTLLVDGTPVQEVPLRAQGIAPAGWAVALTGLTREAHVGSYIDVTLDFQRAGRLTVRVPVEAGDNGLSQRTPEQDPYAEG
ncbi:MAG TPA: copper chaperone PCu(A)C [Mycobacteriales bacterium]|nr:copper chaperone PCu(A)C [Mycobacteriales bacterium]